MPAMLDDPTAPAIYRVSGAPPYPTPYGPLPPDVGLRQVTLRDRVTIATIVPFSSPHQVPHQLTAYLCELLNREIDKGDTYPMMERMPLSSFGPYWFANFGAVMLLGDIASVEEVTRMDERGADWAKECLGSFYIKPNYPGRSSHVCNGGFLVTDAARNRGVGRLMGEGYLEWAPKLGYTYSVFNLVYETNPASLRIWDALGFKRIGRVKGCGNLKSFPDQLIDAIIFGRELGGDGDDFETGERFDKIRFYLKTGTYPHGSDRAEKSRLRSAATHYRLVPNESGGDDEEEKLMLKGKEVVSDPNKQYEIARTMHAASHGGINKTTANIAEKYHWVRIKETVSVVIRNCSDCQNIGPKGTQMFVQPQRRLKEPSSSSSQTQASPQDIQGTDGLPGEEQLLAQAMAGAEAHQLQGPPQQQHQQAAPMADMHYGAADYGDMQVDPQLMNSIQQWQSQQISSQVVADMAADHSMIIDGLKTDGQQPGTTNRGTGGVDDDADARLQKQLEEQIMADDPTYRQRMEQAG